MKKIIIHAGPGKTGTSAIQYWCVSHREILQKNGIFYPEHALDKNKVSNGHIGLIAKRNEEQKYIIDESKLNVLLSEFQLSGCDCLLLSSEYFVEHIPELLKLLDNSNILLYFRDPIELHQSSYIQKVKRHQCSDAYKIRSHINYPILNLMDRLMLNVESDRIFIRPYDVSLSGSNDLVSDFLNFVKPDLSLRVNFQKSTRINESYSFAALEFKRLCNFFPIEKIEMKLDSILQELEGRERDYSLLSYTSYSHHIAKMKLKLSSIQAKYSLEQSGLWLNEVNVWLSKLESDMKVKALPVCLLDDLEKIANKIKQHDPVFFSKLAQIISLNPFIYVGEQAFFGLFEQNKLRKRDYFLLKKTKRNYSEPTVSTPDISAFNHLRKRLNMGTSVNQVMIYAAMADFMLESGECEMAEKLINKAIELNPTNELALALVNPIRMEAQSGKHEK